MAHRQMCELWQSQIHDSTSDGVTMDVLAAMNRVTLDIVGLAGKMPLNPHALSSRVCRIRSLTQMLCYFFLPGFGYSFDALESREDDLSSAFDAIMKTDNSPAQSTIIPLIGSIAPWVISIVSLHRFRTIMSRGQVLIRIGSSLSELTTLGTVLRPLWTKWGWRSFKRGSKSSSRRKRPVLRAPPARIF